MGTKTKSIGDPLIRKRNHRASQLERREKQAILMANQGERIAVARVNFVGQKVGLQTILWGSRGFSWRPLNQILRKL